MDGHLSLYLELWCHDGEELDEAAAEGTVAGHDVAYLGVPKATDERAYHAVAEVVERTFVFGEVGRREPVPDHHVDLPVQYHVDHLGGILSRVGVVAVDHDVAVGIHFAEHPPDHVAFALTRLTAYYGSGFQRQLSRAVGRVVVIDVYLGIGQSGTKRGHHGFHRGGLIIAWYQYCYFHYPTFTPLVTGWLGVISTRRPSLSSALRIMPWLSTPFSLRGGKLAMKHTCLPTRAVGSV